MGSEMCIRDRVLGGKVTYHVLLLLMGILMVGSGFPSPRASCRFSLATLSLLSSVSAWDRVRSTRRQW